MTIQQQVNAIRGEYLIRNPYTKGNKKTLPFNVIGCSFNDTFPVEVQTFEYRGMKRNSITTTYTLESVLQIINK